MISFKQFLIESEVVASKRSGIQHFEQLKPLEFIELLEKLESSGGVIPKGEEHFTEKIDGFGLRFGLSTEGKFFIESSRSGPVFSPGHFISYATSKGATDLKIPMAYEDLFKTLSSNKELIKILNDYSNDGIKVIAECLYNPLGRELNNKIEFIATKYDKNKLGSIATLVMFTALSGPDFKDSISNSKECLKKITLLTSSSIKFSTLPSLKNEKINLNVEIKSLKDLITNKDYKTLLTSRKGDDKPLRKALEMAIEELKEKTLDKILNSLSQIGAFGDEYEGSVLKLSDGSTYKFISPRFKTRKKDYNAEWQKEHSK